MTAGRRAGDDAPTAVVTGGSRGIGYAAAGQLVAQGYRVAALSRSGTAPDGALGLCCDVRDGEQVRAAVAAAAAAHGPARVLIANAGVTDDRLLLRMDEDSFTAIVDANLTSAYRLVHAVAGPMLRARAGRLIFVSSVVALGGAAGQANYAASKSGLIGLARSFAREFGRRGVTSNVVTPGFVETAMTAGLVGRLRDEHRAQIPLGRFASPSDVASVLTFLASDAAGYVNGAVVPVDGGLGMGH